MIARAAHLNHMEAGHVIERNGPDAGAASPGAARIEERLWSR